MLRRGCYLFGHNLITVSACFFFPQVQKSYIHTGVNTEIEDGAVSTCNLFLQESCTGLLMEQIRNSQDAPSYQYQMEVNKVTI